MVIIRVETDAVYYFTPHFNSFVYCLLENNENIFPKGLSKGSLIGLTSSRSTSMNTPNSGPPSASSLTCEFGNILEIFNFCYHFKTCIFILFAAIISVSQDSRGPLAQSRPKCNSVLHLFGEWLFEAAHIGGETWLQNIKSN